MDDAAKTDIERMVEATGAVIPLAGRIVTLIVESGATNTEVWSALDLVRMVAKNLKLKSTREEGDNILSQFG